MSDVPKTVEETPAPAAEPVPVPEASETAKPSETTAESEPSATTKPIEGEATTTAGDVAPVTAKEETAKADKDEVIVEATPITEGVLGYKTTGFIPKFRFHEHFFWFDDTPSTAESLTSYVRSKDVKTAHPNAAWAQETGKGLLFYAKRAEDKSSPAGIINLSDATVVTKEGADEFFFKAHGHKHTFQVKKAADLAGWIVALEKKIEEAKATKEEVHNGEGYKKHLEAFTKAPAPAAATTTVASATREQKKSLEAAQATNGTDKNTVGADGATEEKKEKETKSRSQSQKRGSIFSSLLGKKEDKDEQKEVKKEETKEEEAKATDEPGTVAEAGVVAAAAAAAAAVPAAAVVAEEKKHDKPETEATTPTEKKSKRASIFGGLFAKKDATSPTSEKAEKDDAPSVPAKDADVLPVSDTAPKIEEPIANKPIDTAAVTAPIDTAQTTAAAETTSETPKETAGAETSTTPTKEKKGGLLGFIKKEAAKLESKKDVKKEDTAEKKEEKVAEAVSKDPVVAATTDSPTTKEETAAPVTEDAKPAEKRRSSLFGNLGGSVKKITHNSDATPDAAAAEAGTKRERSPLPQRFGSLFRRPSRGVKSEEAKEAAVAGTDATPTTETSPTPVVKDETAVTNGTAPVEAPDSTTVGDVVPDTTPPVSHDAVTTAAEVKASA